MSPTAGRPASRRSSRVGLLLVVGLLAIGSVFAYYRVRTLWYYPTLRVETPDGYAFTVVQDRRRDRSDCGDANARFLAPLQTACADCKLVYARCLSKLEGVALTLVIENPPPLYVVNAPRLRMAVSGPLGQLETVCDGIAAGLVKAGLPYAACAYPRDRSSNKPHQQKGPGTGPR
jgi:hypothetical protein